MSNRGKGLDPEVFCIADLEEKGSANLPKAYRDYYNDGAMDMLTSLRDNQNAFDRYKIRPRVLRNVSKVDPSTTICDTKVSFPFGFSPAAMHKIAHPDGEVGTSRAAAAIGVPMGLSAYATDPLEAVIEAGRGNPYFMQVNFLMDKSIMIDILTRAERSGYKAILLTVDAPIYGIRHNEGRNNFCPPEGIQYPNMAPGKELRFDVEEEYSLDYDPSLTWKEAVDFLRKHTKLDIWIKGVYTPEDVSLAISHGLEGVVISNHGGRQLDSVPATLDALRECAPVAKGKIAIAIDGGIRRGSDIFKAIALGADFCFAGRIPIWGLAYNGTAGVELSLKILYKEFKQVMGLAGCVSLFPEVGQLNTDIKSRCTNVGEINRSHLSVLDCKGRLSKI
ncbi:FMN-dependent dehydrogenase [Penicillium pulvis]|uniref:FMN-dependent dehydrogenase n=1 Tax=Penicillium pulvis TaxID=1562058 RepID=UPI00254840D0|nr:FMN-dependent dehydrogenase [Penicillium pulvis]KAJ5786795.1 FMN-dependent dehydrogenase [Penicillium pulvis]